MSEAHDNHHGGHQAHAEVEADRLKAGYVGLAILAICVVIVLLVAFADQYFTQRVSAEIQSKILGKESAQLTELRATEERRLAHYQWADQKNGVVRIPVERAAELVLDDYSKPLPPPPAPVAVDGGAAPAAAADGGVAATAPVKDEAKKEAAPAKDEAKKETAPAKDAAKEPAKEKEGAKAEHSPAPPTKAEAAPSHGGGEGAAK